MLDSNGYGEQVVEATVTIPSQNDAVNPYWCDVSDPNDCWVTVRAQFSGGMTDATTWTANLIGDGLYGVDLKRVGRRVVVIEVNDNPSIEAGYEDAVLKDALYREIMGSMLRRIIWIASPSRPTAYRQQAKVSTT